MELHIKKWHIYTAIGLFVSALGLAIVWGVIKPAQDNAAVQIKQEMQKAKQAIDCRDSLVHEVIPAMEQHANAVVDSAKTEIIKTREKQQRDFSKQLKRYEENIIRIDSLPDDVLDSLTRRRLSENNSYR